MLKCRTWVKKLGLCTKSTEPLVFRSNRIFSTHRLSTENQTPPQLSSHHQKAVLALLGCLLFTLSTSLTITNNLN